MGPLGPAHALPIQAADHADPSQRMTEPPPTAHTSLGPLPHTPVSGFEVMGTPAITRPFQ
jgi:hypothetical protein